MFKFSSLLQTIGVIIGVFLATIANANVPATYSTLINTVNTVVNIKNIGKNSVTTDLKGKGACKFKRVIYKHGTLEINT